MEQICLPRCQRLDAFVLGSRLKVVNHVDRRASTVDGEARDANLSLVMDTRFSTCSI